MFDVSISRCSATRRMQMRYALKSAPILSSAHDCKMRRVFLALKWCARVGAFPRVFRLFPSHSSRQLREDCSNAGCRERRDRATSRTRASPIGVLSVPSKQIRAVCTFDRRNRLTGVTRHRVFASPCKFFKGGYIFSYLK